MKALRRLVVAIVIPAMMLAIFAVTIVAAKGPDGKTTVCHLTGNGGYHAITISNNALAAHFRIGDVLPDAYGNCP